MKTAETRHVLSNSRAQWIHAGLCYVFWLLFFMWYHNVRGLPYNLHNLEKCTGIASVFCLAMALSFGPLSRFIGRFDQLLSYRRPLGVVAAFGSLPHVLLAILYLPIGVSNKFSPDFFMSWFVVHWFTVVVGAIAMLLFVGIAMSSYPSAFRKFGKRRWMFFQKLSYLVMILLVLHMLSMGKIPKNWIAWLQTRDKPFPPGSFPVMVACIVPLLLKVVDLVVHGDSLANKPNQAIDSDKK
jgi:DMSO/TMAO reductase YedYZ heme-binding membrane subunit